MNVKKIPSPDFLLLALATFFLINGVFSGAFDIYKYERGCEDFKNYRSNLNELERLDGVLSDLQDEINDLWVPCKKHRFLYLFYQNTVILSTRFDDVTFVNKSKRLGGILKQYLT